MTDTPEPGPEDATPAEPDAAVEPATPRRQSVWQRLNRTNRIAALVLGGVASVFVAVLMFGAGVMVGGELGESEGHHHESGSSEYEGDHEGDGGSDEGGDHEGDGGSDGNDDRGEPGQQPRSGAPTSPAPGTPKP